uniref:Transposase n=1 Tax=Aromatoleum anaerobium TaxID=182180 RepID=A0ABX1PSL3_9RHOO
MAASISEHMPMHMHIPIICCVGLAPVTRDGRVKQVGAFLVRAFGTQPPVISQLSGTLPESHLAYFISDAVDGLDLSAFHARVIFHSALI